MGGGKGRPVLWELERAKLGFPLVLFFCLFFFFAGFYGSIPVSQDFLDFDRFRRQRLTQLSESDMVEVEPAMPHGVTGESEPHAGLPFQILSWRPRTLYFPKFATPEECHGIIRTSRSKLSPSTLALRDGETAESTKGIRTRTFTFSATKLGRVLIQNMDCQIATFLIYLSDVDEGGETMFPYENGSNVDIEYDYFKCIGLTVKPRQGDGLLFYSVLTNGTIDPTSLHGSCPVIKGEKWVATKWLRDQVEQ